MTAPQASRPVKSILHRLLHSEASAGVLLMLAAALAILIANSPWADGYEHLLHAQLGPTLSDKLGPMTVHLWINDGLMALFFLLVGLEIKRELLDGRLATWEQRRLPALPALLGMLLPALIFLGMTAGQAGLSDGWAIPAATDIAFAMGVLALLGRHAPASLKLLLVSVAILDDLGAVLIIAVFYTSSLDLAALGASALTLGGLLALNRLGVTRLWPYLLGCVVLWYFTLLSGVHATVAGVVGALLIPHRPAAEQSPLVRLEHGLAPWSALLIVPLFGFANAGVSFHGLSLADALQPLPLGIALGLLLGKQLGVFAGVWLAVKTGLARCPEGASWTQLYGMSMLCGIGFTMSLFISALAYPQHPAWVEQAKLGILLGSLVSALLACAVLRLAARREAQASMSPAA
ncbi:Na+/H+ antiporter NhaA [Pseudomonas sp. DTU_2021_1001937_2_SI_NGA_ILE_001]|uniref:Na+/H+ antiporter NhaA n=1 Tax=Pseudomonas sp. DTU_2021_1001937_2_SI_NGA_ILE_001 TaxID=3077589 RepID=UPI0028FC0B06|nr:Na+/H+ antiporter NhaA [Pseudomonas sp. DTU_2021_1001937_2_SI_NGA_ILE_001]WNW10208.1 Na+/H+ antiporter NhaA [Pseudomonas sp. DTU_2021_1001937_2_SI_NGA_ILE_001]